MRFKLQAFTHSSFRTLKILFIQSFQILASKARELHVSPNACQRSTRASRVAECWPAKHESVKRRLGAHGNLRSRASLASIVMIVATPIGTPKSREHWWLLTKHTSPAEIDGARFAMSGPATHQGSYLESDRFKLTHTHHCLGSHTPLGPWGQGPGQFH